MLRWLSAIEKSVRKLQTLTSERAQKNHLANVRVFDKLHTLEFEGLGLALDKLL
jgi:hypothetical protein